MEVRPESEIFAPSAATRYLMQRRDQHGRVLDVNPADRSANSTPLWPGLPAVLQIEPVRGFNPIDVLRYKEYLQLLTGRDEPLRPLDRLFTSALLGTFVIENSSLADLLGIRYLLLPADVPLGAIIREPGALAHWHKVAEDPAATTFTFIPATTSGVDAGVQQLGPYCVYENDQALPRVFVVGESASLPVERSEVSAALRTTDFRQRVLLEGDAARAGAVNHGSKTRSAELLDYQPNRVTARVHGDVPGFLVLTDIWYPGWTCTVDGVPVAVLRGLPVPCRSRAGR